jgi:hypothetical protein
MAVLHEHGHNSVYRASLMTIGRPCMTAATQPDAVLSSTRAEPLQDVWQLTSLQPSAPSVDTPVHKHTCFAMLFKWAAELRLWYAACCGNSWPTAAEAEACGVPVNQPNYRAAAPQLFRAGMLHPFSLTSRFSR